MLCHNPEYPQSITTEKNLAMIRGLVRLSSSLASLQLIQIPSADGQIALVVVHAFAEVLCVSCAGWVFPSGLRGVGGVKAAVHGLGVCDGSCLLFGGRAGAA